MMRRIYCSVAFLLIAISGQQHALAKAANVPPIICLLKEGDEHAVEKNLIGNWVEVAYEKEPEKSPSVMKIQPGKIVIVEKQLAIGANWRLQDYGVFEMFEAKKPDDIRESCAAMRGNKLVLTSLSGVETILVRLK